MRAGLAVVFVLLACLVAGAASARDFWPWHRQADSNRPGESSSIEARSLPPEARTTLALIRRGGPFPYAKDGTVFANREGRLPRRQRGYYTEYTVKTPGSRDRGARRIIAGGDPVSAGEYWYTDDHYQTFQRIRE